MTRLLLPSIAVPSDLKGLSILELAGLAQEIRSLIVGTVSVTGGHLASSLGAVEIAISLHHVFNTPEDKIIWDVGHQAYAHKILTGRRDIFHTLRQRHGISGFPRLDESPYDAFIAGHSSTSISAALGMAVARDLAKKDFKVIAVIGDGSLTAGLAFEGLNQAGHLKRDLIVLFNDNEMSISKNVGALSSFLSQKITGVFATRIKKEMENFLSSIPRIGPRLMSLAKRAEDSIMTLLTPGMLFEAMGFHYVGPIDGHDMGALVRTFEDVSEIKGPVLIHAMTKKGKGYGPAEREPSLFHGIGAFDVQTGKPKKPARPTYTDAFSRALIELANKDHRVVAITAAMGEGTGLARFAEEFPDRFFDVGIAEQHALVFAAGLAKEGFIPVVAIYSTFLQRAYDQVFHDVCLQNLPVIIAMDRAGIVGADGPTHHGLFDISYLRHLPNMVVCAPKDEEELRAMLFSAPRYGSPVAIRYPRGECMGVDIKNPPGQIPLAKAEVLRQGKDIAILAIGSTVYPALEAAGRLEQAGISACVVNSRFAKPLDEALIIEMALSTGRLLTVEENVLAGGFGSAVAELLESSGVPCSLKRLGVPDCFVEHGQQEELRACLSLDAKGIEGVAREFVRESVHKGKARF